MNKWLVFAGILSALVSASPIDDSDVVEAVRTINPFNQTKISQIN